MTYFAGSKIEFPINWVHMEFPETIRTVTLDKTSAEYVELEKQFLFSVKNGIYNTGKAPNPAFHPVGQFNKVKVHKVNCIAVRKRKICLKSLYPHGSQAGFFGSHLFWRHNNDINHF